MNRIVIQTRHAITLIRLKPFDSSTLEGRANERHRRIALTAITAAISKCISIVTALITIPLTVDYLGAERYGMWATLSSSIALLAFADLGLGNGLLNAITEANGKDDRNMAQRYVSSAFVLLTGIALFLAIFFILIYPLVAWHKLFGVTSSQAIDEAGPAMFVFLACFLFNLPLGIVQYVQMGYQEGYVNSIWICLGNLFGLFGVLFVIYVKAGLPWLVLAMAGSPIIASALNSIYFYSYKHPWLRPKWNFISILSAKKIFKVGFLFFILQIAGAVAFQSDNLIIAQILGANQVTQYAIPMRMFSLVIALTSFVLTPLWPAYGEAINRRDMIWIKQTLKRSIGFSLLIVTVPTFVLVVFGQQIIHLWVGSEITPSFSLLLGLGCWAILYAILNPIAMFMNGVNIIGFQIITASLMAIVNLLLSIVLVYTIGISGAIWGTVISLIICSFIPAIFYIPRVISSHGGDG